MASLNSTEANSAIDNQDFYNKNLGPFCAGLAFQMFMMGVLTLQTWTYFETMSSHDSARNNWLVTAMFILGAFQTGTDFQLMYDAFVTGYGRIEYWNKYGWTFTYELGWTALIAAIAQCFFLHRCYAITKLKFIVAICGTGVLLSFGSGLAASIGLIAAKYYTRTDMIIVPGTIWLIATASTDLSISLILIVKLRTTRTDFRTTERIISKLTRLAFETAALTSLIAILNLILYAGFGKKNSIHLFFQFTVGKMYSHSVMVTLLARRSIRQGDGIHFQTSSGKPDSGSDLSGITVTTTRLRVADVETDYRKKPFDGKPVYPLKPLDVHTKPNVHYEETIIDNSTRPTHDA